MSNLEAKLVDYTKIFRSKNKIEVDGTVGKTRNYLSHQKNISSNQLFSNLLSKTVTFTEFRWHLFPWHPKKKVLRSAVIIFISQNIFAIQN